MSKYLTEAFRQMDELNEDTFQVTSDGGKKLKDFLDGDHIDDIEVVIDPEAETEEDLQDSYVGKVILNCPVCEAKIYKDVEDIIIDDDVDLVNVDEECPYCQSLGGYEVVGQVEEFDVADELHNQDDVDEGLLDPVKNIAGNLPGPAGKLLGEGAVGTAIGGTAGAVAGGTAGNLAGGAVGKQVGKAAGTLGGAVIGGALGGVPGAAIGAAVGRAAGKSAGKKIGKVAGTAIGGTAGAVAGGAAGNAIGNAVKGSKKESVDNENRSIRSRKQEGLLDPIKNVAKSVPGVGNLLGESEEEQVDEGIGGALVGGVLGGAIGGVPGAVAGAAGGHFLQKNLKKEDVSKSRIARRGAKKEGLLDPVKNIAGNLPGVGNILGEADESDEINVEEGLLDPVKNVAKNIPGVGNLIGEAYEDDLVEGAYYRGFIISKAGDKFMIDGFGESYDTYEDAKAGVDSWIEDDGIDPRVLNEDFKKVNIETDDSVMTMDSDDSGKVTVTTEPKQKVEGEVITPISDENKDKILGVDEPTVDVEVDEFSEEDFDELGEGYLKRVYENVESYKTVKGKIDKNSMIFEGIITFTSGKKAKTSFIFESTTATKTGKVKFVGKNPQISRNNKAFTLTGRVKGGKLVTESFTYNYLAKDADAKKSKKLYGTINKK